MEGRAGEFIWAQKYRPRTIDECVLPERLKETFRSMLTDGDMPNLILAGHHGIGKTTVARALCEEMGDATVYEINASLHSGIDTLRSDIKTFASTQSLTGSGRKVVILDEADYLNAQSTQPALRAFMEEFSKSCTFILTCNYKNRIIEPLRSRCTVIDFDISPEEKPLLAKQFLRRVENILSAEEIEYDKKCIIPLIIKHFPDWRRVLNELQRYAAGGRIDAGILAADTSSDIDELMGHLKHRRFTDMRAWVAQNVGRDTSNIFRALYDHASKFILPESIPQLVILLADYQYKAAFVADHEINMVACLTEIMSECQFA